MVNYLTRLESPLRVVNFMPPELAIFGEDEVLGAIQRAPPRFVLLCTGHIGIPVPAVRHRRALRSADTWMDRAALSSDSDHRRATARSNGPRYGAVRTYAQCAILKGHPLRHPITM